MNCQNPRCGKPLINPRPKTRYCNLECRREHQRVECKNGHDLTLPGAVRKDRNSLNRCVACEKAAGERYRRRKGVKTREAWARSIRKSDAHKHSVKMASQMRRRRAAGVRPRESIRPTYVEQPSGIPAELRRAWGRAGWGSQMRRKFPTLESLKRAYHRGELPEVRMEAW